ncbi:MAG: DUF4080 domain-containing protein [Clostridia bacterium]|nr:DUF4080 domain-containing protein [Clostridia bacterium]
MAAKTENLLIGINTRYTHTNPALAILSLACRRRAVSLSTVEFSVNMPFSEILRDIYLMGAKRLVFSCYIWNIELVRRLSQSLKAVMPEAVIVWGGSEMYGESGHWLAEETSVDYILTGEGEIALPALLTALAAETDLAKVPNLFWCKDGQIIANPPAPLVDLSQEPFIYEETDLKMFKHKIVYYESSRGCPFGCYFCLSAKEPPRYRELALVKQDILKMAAGGVKQIKFIDRTFNADLKRAKEILRFLLELAPSYPELNFHLEIEPSLLNEEIVGLLCRAPKGFLQMEAGVQSLNTEALKAIGRHNLWQKHKHFLQRLIEADNIHVHLDLIAGLPFEDMTSFAAGFNELYAMQPHYLQLGFLKILPGTVLAKAAKDFGLIWQKQPPYQVLATPWLSYADICELMWTEYGIEQYYNGGFFKHTLADAVLGYAAGALQFYTRLGKASYESGKLNLESKALFLLEFLMTEFAEPKDHWCRLLSNDYTENGQKVPKALQA